MDTVLCCQLAPWAVGVDWRIAVVEENTHKFLVRGPGHIAFHVFGCLTHTAGLASVLWVQSLLFLTVNHHLPPVVTVRSVNPEILPVLW